MEVEKVGSCVVIRFVSDNGENRIHPKFIHEFHKALDQAERCRRKAIRARDKPCAYRVANAVLSFILFGGGRRVTPTEWALPHQRISVVFKVLFCM